MDWYRTRIVSGTVHTIQVHQKYIRYILNMGEGMGEFFFALLCRHFHPTEYSWSLYF
jgi:hypothetical protein